MKVSTLSTIVWQLALAEAVAAEFGEILPEHVFTALLKCAELPVEEVANAAPDKKAAKQLAEEVSILREELLGQAIDGKRVRHGVRDKLGKGGIPFDGKQMHRSTECRAIFNKAEKLANDTGDKAIMTFHLLRILLKSPTPVIAQILKSVKSSETTSHQATFLAQIGVDLTHCASEDWPPASLEHLAEQKELLNTLAQDGDKSVLLVSDNSDDVRALVLGVAQAISAKNAPRALKGTRIVDVTAVHPSGEKAEDGLKQMERIFREAAHIENLILFVPAVTDERRERDLTQWARQLGLVLSQGSLRCVCQVTKAFYEKHIKNDTTWERSVNVMRVNTGIRRKSMEQGAATASVFVSYSHEDNRWIQEGPFGLVPWLARNLKRDGVEFWYDPALNELPGEEFKKRIKHEIDRARFAMLLISQSFVGSEFIRDFELPLIRERVESRAMSIIPILVGPVDWEEDEEDLNWLSDRQMLPGKPQSLISYTGDPSKWEHIRVEILASIKKRVKVLRKSIIDNGTEDQIL